MPEPLYTAENCRAAYQLHWSLTAFSSEPVPPADAWQESLAEALDADGVRLLEVELDAATAQFFLSTRPETSPPDMVRVVKGRLQYLLRQAIPKLWRRHYSLISVGSAKNTVLQNYVGNQVQHHPLADDERMTERLTRFQFRDPKLDLNATRSSGHAQFTHNLYIVLENAEHLTDVREESLQATRTMLIAACARKEWLLSRLGIVGNHLHMLLAARITDAPRDVVLSLMNNLAFAHGMRRVLENGYYVGTFGPYDHQAIRRRITVADQ